MNRQTSLVILCGVAFLLSGVAPATAESIADLVTKYDSGIQKGLPVIKEFYIRANDFQRDMYFDELLFDTSKEMGLSKDGKDTALLHKYSDAEINSRILALSLISNYSSALLQLSDPKKAKTAESDLQSLGNKIADITKKLGAVAQAAPIISSYATAAGGLAGLVNKQLTKMKQEIALKKTIKEGAPQVEKLLELLEKDTLIFSEDIYKNAAQGNLNEFIRHYNKSFVQIQQDKPIEMLAANRLTFLQKTKSSAERYVSVSNLNPAATLTRIRKVNQDLLGWATSVKGQPFNMDQLSKDIDSYLDDIDTIMNAAALLRSGK